MTAPLNQVFTTDHTADAGHCLDEAVQWFAANQTSCERPFIPAIRRRFGLSAADAVAVLRLANLRHDWPQGGANVPQP